MRAAFALAFALAGSLFVARPARADAPPPFVPVTHGWVALDLAGGACTRPEHSQPCHSTGLIPEATAVLAATHELDPAWALEWRLGLSIGLTDTIGTLRQNPLRTILGLIGEMAVRWQPWRDGFYFAAGIRAGQQISTEDFVTTYIDPVTHLSVPQRVAGQSDPRLGVTAGVGWLLGSGRGTDFGVRVFADTGSIGLRATLGLRLD